MKPLRMSDISRPVTDPTGRIVGFERIKTVKPEKPVENAVGANPAPPPNPGDASSRWPKLRMHTGGHNLILPTILGFFAFMTVFVIVAMITGVWGR